MATSGRIEIDHYMVLGLPTGERGAKLSDQEIKKAFQSKAMVTHPDKSRHDPNAHANFLKLQQSYQILKDSKSRKAFDNDMLRRERVSVRRCEGQRDPKRRKMKSDLEEAERRSAAGDFGVKQSREEDERYARVLNAEIARVIARHNKEKHEAAAAAAAAAKDSSRFKFNGSPTQNNNNNNNSDNDGAWFATATPQEFDNYVLERIRRIKEIAKSRSESGSG